VEIVRNAEAMETKVSLAELKTQDGSNDLGMVA
jgi:hypothetical protein